ncbi:MAG: class I SAM-dependent methyltransferase [Oscillospiraceae bacterium]|nr:class I SAM-dependent methyltransferase [Oscillospiraceae bacterium]
MLVAEGWQDYELIDTGFGEKLERWGEYILRRPDPQVLWPNDSKEKRWSGADAVYHRSDKGGGYWEYIREIPDKWVIGYEGLRFQIQPMQFKHTGLFPEQIVNWKWIKAKIEEERTRRQSCGIDDTINVLNLFAYTGAATMTAVLAGARVCHVDASRGMVQRAKENVALSGLPYELTRYIVDDVFKFVRREIKRNRKYDGIIMDPPTYGRGPDGELWKIEYHLFDLVEQCVALLSLRPSFIIVNSYASALSPATVGNLLSLSVERKYGGRTSYHEIGIRSSSRSVVLPCGFCGRWEA